MTNFHLFSAIIFIALLGQSCQEQKLEKETSAKIVTENTQSKYVDSVNTYRSTHDGELKMEKNSPLMEEKKAGFKGLKYYSVNEKWVIEAHYTKIDSGEVFEMPTTTERVIEMQKDGKITFTVNGKTFHLFAYRYIAYPDEDLFVPFLDATNGDVTYGGGRYLNVADPKGETIWLDFNMAYNPYCAYNHAYSCPIPPLENRLDLAVTAGEKVLYTY